MEKMAARRAIGRMLDDGILPSVMMELNKASNHLKVVKVGRCNDDYAEVTLVELDNVTRRHTVDLQNHKCSCRKWQITGKSCNHALAWICSNRGRIADYVSEYYSVQRFRTAYDGLVPPMTDRTQWPVVHSGYKFYPLRQKRRPGRPKVQRIRGFLELGRRTVRCKRCGGTRHFEKTCKLAEQESNEDTSEGYVSSDNTPKKRKRKCTTDEVEIETPPKKKKKKKKKKDTKKEAGHTKEEEDTKEEEGSSCIKCTTSQSGPKAHRLPVTRMTKSVHCGQALRTMYPVLKLCVL